jgi:hypothetical protein
VLRPGSVIPLAALASLIATPQAAAATAASDVDVPPCQPGAGREVRAIGGEIAGEHDYREDLGNGWTFALVRDAFGWNVRVLDAKGMDLTQLTPPYRFAPNAREIYGWHFRNTDNTGPNDGTVNAPQRRRLFTISPGVSGTGGFKPSAADAADAGTASSGGAATADGEASPSPDGAVAAGGDASADGRGMLTILDYGLADLEPGVQARMVYLKFAACLSWPAAPGSAAAGPAITAEDVERFGRCGLAAPFALDPYLVPATQSGDFDGDGAHDLAATIARKSDGKRGVAICRASTWLHVVGIEESLGELTPAYFDRMDYWRVDPQTTVPVTMADGAPPVLRGDGLTIGMDGKSSVLLYWDGARFQSHWQGD